MRVSVKLDDAELKRAFNRLSETAAAGHLKRVVTPETERVVATAKALAPVDTGQLRADIRIIEDEIKPGRFIQSVGVDSPARWHIARFQEFGTGKGRKKPLKRKRRKKSEGYIGHGAHPFLRPAVRRNRKAVIGNIHDRLRARILRACR